MKKNFFKVLLAMVLAFLCMPFFKSSIVQEVQAADMVFNSLAIVNEDLEVVVGKTPKVVGKIKWTGAPLDGESELNTFIVSRVTNESYWFDETTNQKATVFEKDHNYSYVARVAIKDYDQIKAKSSVFLSALYVNDFDVDLAQRTEPETIGDITSFDCGRIHRYEYTFAKTISSDVFTINYSEDSNSDGTKVPWIYQCPQTESYRFETDVKWTCEDTNVIINTKTYDEKNYYYVSAKKPGVYTLKYTLTNGKTGEVKAYAGDYRISDVTFNTSSVTLAKSTEEYFELKGQPDIYAGDYYGVNHYMPEVEGIPYDEYLPSKNRYNHWYGEVMQEYCDNRDTDDSGWKPWGLASKEIGTFEVSFSGNLSGKTINDKITVNFVDSDKEINASPLAATMYLGTSIHLNITKDAPVTDYTWTSSDESIVSVDQNAVVKALQYVKDKEVTITGTKADGSTVTSVITVDAPTKGVEVTPATLQMKVGETAQINYSAVTESETKPQGYYLPSQTVVSVDDSGKVEALLPGTAEVRVYADGKYGTCKITVLPATTASTPTTTPTPTPTVTPVPTTTPTPTSVPEIISETDKGVKIENTNGVIPNGVKLTSEVITSGTQLETTKAVLGDKLNNTDYVIMELNLIDTDGQYVHNLNGTVTVTVDLPFVVQEGHTIDVYRVEGDKYVKYDSKIVGDKLVFTADHFSTYVYVDVAPKQNVPANSTPSTADHNPVFLYFALMIGGAMSGAYILYKKRFN